MTAVALLVAVLTTAGCGVDLEPTGSTTAGSAVKGARPKGPAPSLTWKFARIADFHGKYTDIAVLAEDDVWVVGREMDTTPRLLHYDGRQWRREPLPEALGTVHRPPALEEIGDSVWLRPQAGDEDTGVRHWATWDGARWSAVPNPPPRTPGGEDLALWSLTRDDRYVDAAGPDEIWVLDGERTAQHWDGTRWTTTRLPYRTTDLAVVKPDDVWAVGSRSTGPGTELSSGDRYRQPASMHWDGTSWEPVDTPQAHFEEPLPPSPFAELERAYVLDSGEVRAYGTNSYTVGEVDDEPPIGHIRLRWDGSQWVEQKPAPGGCALRRPVGQDHGGLFLDGNRYLTDDGRCVKIKHPRLPLSTGAREKSRQSLWLEELHQVPGTDEWMGAGHVDVNQAGAPFPAPVVVRLTRGG
jgi:hypothetical protein